MKMKTLKYSFRIIIVFLFLFIVACEKGNDKPPKMESPEPRPHKGIFVSDQAIFTFDGSKNTVFVEFNEEYMNELNNPPNNTYYSYVFTWYEFGECRYDVATNLKLYHEKSNIQLDFLIIGNVAANRIEISSTMTDAKNLELVKQE